MNMIEPSGEDRLEDELFRAVQILRTSDHDLDSVLVDIQRSVKKYLNGLASHTRRVGEEKKSLIRIAEEARSLAFHLREIDPINLNSMMEDVFPGPADELLQMTGYESEFVEPRDTYGRFVEVILQRISKASSLQADSLPDDKGGRKTLRRHLDIGDPASTFIEDMMRIYEFHRGSHCITGTIPSVPGTGHSCFAFIDAVHMYATGEGFGRRELFRRKVRWYKEMIFNS